ncbi:MAG: C45 family autoproteolytic acyltransferase/hydrolase [bacterium]
MGEIERQEPRFTRDGQGMVRRDGRIYVLHLQGSDDEMARQHGELLGPEIRAGVMPLMARFLGEQVRDDTDLTSRLLSTFGSAAIDLLSLVLARNTPRELRRAFHEVARAAGVPVRSADLALAVPDTMLFLFGVMDRVLRAGHALPSLGLRRAGFGCCGAIALPEITSSGHLLHGRNMDYDGIGHFDRYPTVAFCRPTRGQPYAWIASAGVHTSALTSMNASGVFLGSNTSPTTDVSLRGMPFFAVNELAIRQARNLGEAVDLLGTRRAVSGYNVHLSHGPSGDAVVVEYAYSRQRIRTPEDGYLVATNHFVDPEMAATIPKLTIVDTANTRGRYARLMSRLAESRGRVTVELLIDCLRDGVEHATGERHPLGDVVCNYLNLTSVVADVTAGRFFATADPAPAALGRYVSFDLAAELDAFGQPRSYPLETVAPAPVAGTPAMRGIRAYMEAHAALSYHGDPAQALGHVAQARSHCPDEPRIALTQGLLALKQNRTEEAAQHAREYLELTPPGDPRRYRAWLVLAWCADLRHARAEAAEHLTRASGEDPGLDDAALELETWRRRPFTERDRRRMHVELFNGKRLLF